jgi:acyl-CoA reductase-like NAD-dependent aldehyde dehydrogenase
VPAVRFFSGFISNLFLIPATFPLGAVKGSGWGRNNGRYGIDEFLSPKVISLNMGNRKLAFEAHSNL